MKLAKVEHEQCDHGVVATTYVMIPDDTTAERFQELAVAARDAYLNAERELKSFPGQPDNPGYQPNYERYPGKTVAEVQEIHKQLMALFKAWEAKRDAARQPYSYHLEKVSNGQIKLFSDFDEDTIPIANIHWGHRHGQRLRYDEPGPCDLDLPGSIPDERERY